MTYRARAYVMGPLLGGGLFTVVNFGYTVSSLGLGRRTAQTNHRWLLLA